MPLHVSAHGMIMLCRRTPTQTASRHHALLPVHGRVFSVFRTPPLPLRTGKSHRVFVRLRPAFFPCFPKFHIQTPAITSSLPECADQHMRPSLSEHFAVLRDRTQTQSSGAPRNFEAQRMNGGECCLRLCAGRAASIDGNPLLPKPASPESSSFEDEGHLVMPETSGTSLQNETELLLREIALLRASNKV